MELSDGIVGRDGTGSEVVGRDCVGCDGVKGGGISSGMGKAVVCGDVRVVLGSNSRKVIGEPWITCGGRVISGADVVGGVIAIEVGADWALGIVVVR